MSRGTWVLIFVTAAALAAVVLALFLLRPPAAVDPFPPAGRPSSDEGEQTRFAITSAVGSDPGFPHYRELTRYICDRLGTNPRLITGLTYHQVDRLFVKGDVDVGFLCNCHYVRREDEAGMELLAAPIVTGYGKPKFQIYIIVHKESGLDSLEDLKGKRVDFSDPLSTTTVYGAYLLAQKNEDLRSYFEKAIFSGSHDMTIELVANRSVDAGFIDGHVWDYHQKVHPLYSSQTRVIHRSMDFAIPPVVVPRGMNEVMKTQIQRILLTMHEDVRGMEILKKLRIDRFVPIAEEDYRFLREMYEKVKDRLP